MNEEYSSFILCSDNNLLFESELCLARKYIATAGDHADMDHFVSIWESIEGEGVTMGWYTKELLASFTLDLQEESTVHRNLVSTLEAAIADVKLAKQIYSKMNKPSATYS